MPEPDETPGSIVNAVTSEHDANAKLIDNRGTGPTWAMPMPSTPGTVAFGPPTPGPPGRIIIRGPHFPIGHSVECPEPSVSPHVSPTHEDLAHQLDQILQQLRDLAERVETLQGSEPTTREKAPPVPQEPITPSGMTPTSS